MFRFFFVLSLFSCKYSANTVEYDRTRSGQFIQECYESGTYRARVEYQNDETNYFANYTLDVIIKDGKLSRICFPSGGYVLGKNLEVSTPDSSCFIQARDRAGKHYNIWILK